MALVLPSIIRTTVVPFIVGWAFVGVVGAPVGVAAVAAFVYYLAVRLLEKKWPKAGVLLGYPKQPTYEEKEDNLQSIIRTFVPLLVGFGVTMLAKYGIEIDTTLLTALFTTAITTVYYGLIRKVEETKPAAGVLIGGVGEPVAYIEAAAA